MLIISSTVRNLHKRNDHDRCCKNILFDSEIHAGEKVKIGWKYATDKVVSLKTEEFTALEFQTIITRCAKSCSFAKDKLNRHLFHGFLSGPGIS